MAEKHSRGIGPSPKRQRAVFFLNHSTPPSVPGSSAKNGTPRILSAPARVFEVIRRFDERKKDMVKSIGFHGLLNLPRFGDLDPNFTLWLMQKVRWNTGALVVGDNINFVMREEHIGKIIGIPYSGLDVREKSFETDDDKLTFQNNSLSFLSHGTNLIDSAEAYLCRDLQFRCTKDICSRFKIAFIIFVMCCFFAPSDDKDNPRSDFWGALRNPDAIHSFNWSSVVLNSILEASRAVVWAAVEGRDVSVILGCPLILQILYLDNIELGQLKLQHSVSPRVKHFNSAVVNQMIQADYVNLDKNTLLPIFGRSETLRDDNTCYNLRNSVKRTSLPVAPDNLTTPTCMKDSPLCKTPKISSGTQKHAQIENARTPKPPLSHKPITIDLCSDQSMGVPLNAQSNHTPLSEAAINVQTVDYSSIMRDFFNGKVDNCLLGYFKFHEAMCLNHITKFTKSLKDAITSENLALLGKVANHQRRANGLSEIKIDQCSSSALRRCYNDMLSGAESGNEVEDVTPATSLSRGARRYKERSAEEPGNFSEDANRQRIEIGKFTTPLNKSLESSFELEMLPVSPKVSPSPEIQPPAGGHLYGSTSDFNQGRFDDNSWNYPRANNTDDNGKLAISHWAMNIDHPTRELAITHSFYDWLTSTNSSDLKRPWIYHDVPRYINLTGQMLKDYFTDILPISYDMFDICIRRIRQLDKSICPRGVMLRWRHLFESDFSMHVLRGDNPAHSLSIRHQVASYHVDYELAKCRMFFVPVFVNGLWWCYAWDMKSRTVTINDPSIGPETDDIVIKKHAGTIGLLSTYLTRTISEFYVDWSPKFADCNYLVHRTPDMPIERSQSALFNLFFVKNFNGTNLTNATSKNAMLNFREYMLYEILELKDNSVKPPNAYIQSIDD